MHVKLDGLSGFEFEGVCAAVFRSLGYRVQESTASGDFGRDLILTDTSGDITVVECKHQAGTVGRPVVQKLHSAALTAGASRAMLISTGGFSNQAIEYAESLTDIRIELVDRCGFEALAARAGFSQDGIHAGALLAVAPTPLLTLRLKRFSVNRLKCDPQFLDRSLTILHREAIPRAVLRVRYSIQVDFVTSAGLIHEINVPEAMLVLDARSFQPLDEVEQTIITTAHAIAGSQHPESAEAEISPEPFMDPAKLQQARKRIPLSLHSVLSNIRFKICELYITVVHYRGRNNVTYSKVCAPTPKDVDVLAIEPLIVPHQIVTVGVKNARYNFALLDNPSDSHVINENLTLCTACNKRNGAMQLCLDCGLVSHKKALFSRCGFKCRCCSKTLCRRCVWKTPFLLIFSRFWCFACLQDQPEKTRRNPSRLSTPSEDRRLVNHDTARPE